MSVSADRVATSSADSMLLMCEAVEGAWAHRSAGLVGGVSGVPLSSLNGVQVESLDARCEDAEAFLDRIAATGLPYSLQVRPGVDPTLRAMAEGRGMELEGRIPLMALENDSRLDAAQLVEGLVVRQLAPDEHAVHVAVLAEGFGMPAELFGPLITPALLGTPGVRCYVGEVDGSAVTTGMGVTVGELVAVFDIATPEAYRGRGYGAAVTARAVVDGLAAGATAAWLQSSPMGYRVYEGLGFTTLEEWECWVTPA